MNAAKPYPEANISQSNETTLATVSAWIETPGDLGFQVEIDLTYDGMQFVTRAVESRSGLLGAINVAAKLQNPRVLRADVVDYRVKSQQEGTP